MQNLVLFLIITLLLMPGAVLAHGNTSSSPVRAHQSLTPDTVFVSAGSPIQSRNVAYDSDLSTLISVNGTSQSVALWNESCNCENASSIWNTPLPTYRFVNGAWAVLALNGSVPHEIPFGQTLLIAAPDQGTVFSFDQQTQCWNRHGILPGTCTNTTSTWVLSGNRWANLTANVSVSPSSLFSGQAVYDTSLGGVLFFGGYRYTPLTNIRIDRAETWLFKNDSWQNLTGSLMLSPSGGNWPYFTYDTADGNAYLMCTSYSGCQHPGTWEFSAGTGWRNVTASVAVPQPLVNGGDITYDSAAGELLAMGPPASGGGESYQLLPNDTLEVDPPAPNLVWALRDGEWVNMTSAASPGPLGRTGVVLFDDPGLNGVVLETGVGSGYGGDYCCSDATCAVPSLVSSYVFGETWVLSGGKWSELHSIPGFGQPPNHTLYYPAYCPIDKGPAIGMLVAGIGMMGASGGALAVMFRNDKMRALGRPTLRPSLGSWILFTILVVAFLVLVWVVTGLMALHGPP